MGGGFGLLGPAHLLQDNEARAGVPGNPLASKPPHFPARARRCIFQFMVRGPSYVDLFDPKPELSALDGRHLPESSGKIHSQLLGGGPLCPGSHRKWRKHGQSGIEMSDLIPHIHPLADEIAVIRSCFVDSIIYAPAHYIIYAPAHYQMSRGRAFMGSPSLGSRVTCGPGSESENLPAFVVMTQLEGTPEGGAPYWGARHLPASYQGILFRNGLGPIINLKPATAEFSPPQRRATPDLFRAMNEADLDPDDTELSARIASCELAYRMQSEAPEAVNFRANRPKPRRFTASTTPSRPNSAPAAFWPDAWSSAACGSSSFIPFRRRHGRHAVGRPRRPWRQSRTYVRSNRSAGHRALDRPEAHRPA